MLVSIKEEDILDLLGLFEGLEVIYLSTVMAEEVSLSKVRPSFDTKISKDFVKDIIFFWRKNRNFIQPENKEQNYVL